MKKFLCILLFMFPTISSSAELGISTSGKAISLDVWSQQHNSTAVGVYGKFLWDFNSYENGSNVTVCRDGEISGSSGSGTCSGHGGASHKKAALFDRYGFSLGATYSILERIRLHTGILVGTYKSDINIGDENKLDFKGYGIDVGVSYSLSNRDGAKITLSFESEQKQSFLGVSFPVGH